MGRFDGRVALITGGESGIGLATARLLVAEGAYVHLAGMDREALAEAGRELGSASCAVSVADVTSAGQVRTAVVDALDRFGRLDIVFSNAGIAGDIASIEDYSEDVFRRVLDVHVVGTFLLLKYTLPHLGPGGSVIINSSVVGLTAEAAISGYATAKHAQVGLMRVAAKEAAQRGIRVNSIHPGPTDTPFQRAVEKTATGLSEEKAFETFNSMIPLGRHATPEEIARTVLYLASEDSAFTTGATLTADGGMTI